MPGSSDQQQDGWHFNTWYLQNIQGSPDICIFFKGNVVLSNDHEVCKKGDVLTPEQARILVSENLN
jgi:hypothetical protein